MTGIAFGNLNIPKISMGNTDIKKVSMGDTLVWPGVVAFDHLAVVSNTGATYSANPLIEKPAVGAGRIAVLLNYSRNNTTTAPSASGTPLTNETNSGSRWISRVILTDATWNGTDYLGSLLMNGNQFNLYYMVILEAQGTDNTPIIATGGTPGSVNSIWTSSNPAAQTVDTTGFGKESAVFAMYSDPAQGTGWNESMKQSTVACEDYTGGSNLSQMMMKYRILKSSPEANVIVDMDGPGTSTSLHSFLITVGVPE